MFYRLCATILVICLGGGLNPAQAAPLALSALRDAPYVPDRVLVKFKPGVAAEERIQANQAASGRVRRTFGSIGVQLIQVPAGSVPAAVRIYASNPNVVFAEPDYYRLLRMPSEEPGPTPAGGVDYFTEQWYLNNEGQKHSYIRTTILGSQLATTQGSADADINAPEAWDISTGRHTSSATARDTPKVAVLDSGADCNSLELQGKCLEQINLVGLTAGYWGDSCPAGDPACDNLGHGTFVSSEVAANTDNGEGIAGIGWDSGLGIFKVCYQEFLYDENIGYFFAGLCPVSGSIAAIENASQDQFDDSGQLVRSRYSIITMSYGSDFIDEGGNIYPTDPSTAECAAIEAAWNNGVLLVAAAGNNGDTGRVYPAACTDVHGDSTVIAVAATDHSDDRTDFTTFSWPTDPWVSLSAPGESIIGILPDAHCGLAPGTDSCVDWWDGTSMAAPLVAGGAALVWADLFEQGLAMINSAGGCGAGAQPCNQAVRERLQHNAAAVGARGQDLRDWTRYGRLDVAAALLNQTSPPEPPPEPGPLVATFSYSCDGYVCTFDATGSTGTGTVDYSWDLGVSGASFDVPLVTFDYGSKGGYSVTLTVRDDSNASQVVSAFLNLKRPNQKLSGSVTSDGGGGNDSGGGGNCPPKKQEKGQC